jgi:type I restriction-modification system DNA methylase subunit
MEKKLLFQKIKKKYALNNSYFKNRLRTDPETPLDVLNYFKEHGELPYQDNGMSEHWIYECFIEFQKRSGVYNSQFFTPPETAERMAEVAEIFFAHQSPYVLDACCGFGMISNAIRKKGFLVSGFDVDNKFQDLYGFFAESNFETNDFRDYTCEGYKHIISNPPYEIKELTEFLECLHGWLAEEGRAVLLLPKGFTDKKHKRISEIMGKFEVIHMEDMKEEFARTKVSAEIVVLEKI